MRIAMETKRMTRLIVDDRIRRVYEFPLDRSPPELDRYLVQGYFEADPAWMRMQSRGSLEAFYSIRKKIARAVAGARARHRTRLLWSVELDDDRSSHGGSVMSENEFRILYP